MDFTYGFADELTKLAVGDNPGSDPVRARRMAENLAEIEGGAMAGAGVTAGGILGSVAGLALGKKGRKLKAALKGGAVGSVAGGLSGLGLASTSAKDTNTFARKYTNSRRFLKDLPSKEKR